MTVNRGIYKPRTRRPIVERFVKYVDFDSEGAHWFWTGYLNANGYGSFYIGDRKQRAHRVAYELFVGPIPEGLDLDHLCRVRHCVNPRHLEPVTRSENLRRGDAGKIHAVRMAQLTHCKRGHQFTNENTYVTTDGRRQCRICQRLNRQAWAEANRERKRIRQRERRAAKRAQIAAARAANNGSSEPVTSSEGVST